MKGFNNLGNTCYLNSGLQMLIQNRDLCNMIRAFRDKSEILNKLSEFIDEYYNNRKNSLSPTFIKEIASGRNSIFMGFQQQDSSEFIVFMLDFINNEVNKVCSAKNLIDKIFEL